MKKGYYFILAAIAVGLIVLYWPQTTTQENNAGQQKTKATPAVRPSGVDGVAVAPAMSRPFKPAKSARAPKTKQPYQLVVQKPRPRAPITLEETPEHLKPVVLQEMSWTRDYLTNLTAADVEILKQWYQQLGTNLTAKGALTWTLGYAGDEEVVEMFKYALFEEYAGKQLTSGSSEKTNEEAVLFENTVKALGFLASKYDSAYELIKQGTNPAFWEGRVKWTSRWSNDTVRMLVYSSIISIGGTGRPDSLEFINHLKEQTFVNGVGQEAGRTPFAAPLVDSAFLYDLVAEHGVETYKLILLTEARTQLQADWFAHTENGRQWFAWAEAAQNAHYLANKAAIDQAYKENREQAAKRKK